ncbi:hypothetical protein ZWY2020_037043 [Hordeum vulgare]|nr:hypothetical protein ZWY2020_037043 [Hordeum vulgare]
MPTPMAARPTSTMATKLPRCRRRRGNATFCLAAGGGARAASSKKRNLWPDPFDDGPDEEFDYTGVYLAGSRRRTRGRRRTRRTPTASLRFPMGTCRAGQPGVQGARRRAPRVLRGSGGVYENVLFFPVVQMLKDRYRRARRRGGVRAREAGLRDVQERPGTTTWSCRPLAGTGHALFLFASSAREKVGYVYPNVNGAGAGLFLTEMFAGDHQPRRRRLQHVPGHAGVAGRLAGVPQQPIPPLRVSISKKLRAVVEDKYNRAGVEKGKYVVIHGIESDSVANMKSRETTTASSPRTVGRDRQGDQVGSASAPDCLVSAPSPANLAS